MKMTWNNFARVGIAAVICLGLPLSACANKTNSVGSSEVKKVSSETPKAKLDGKIVTEDSKAEEKNKTSAGKVSLKDLGFKNGPDNFYLPKNVVIVTKKDEPK